MNLEAARSTLMDHSRSSRNGIFPEVVNFEAKMTNPVCGDHVEIRIHSENAVVRDSGFKAAACAICTASASLVTHHLKGLSHSEILNLGTLFEDSIIEPEQNPWPESLANFRSFEHLRVNPSRRMCALLPWVAIKKALKE